MAGNTECKCRNHAMHLCALKACGLDEHSSDVWNQLTHNPQFVCEKCNDKTAKAENLCKPKKIST